MVDGVMSKIRAQWYGERPPRDWFADQAFIKARVVLWPAKWLDARGLTLPAERYFEIVITKLNDVHAHHGQETFKYLPGYLTKCMQDHFKHNEQAIHDEAKAFSAAVDAAIGKAQSVPAADPVRAMAAAQELVSTKRNNKATQFKTQEQDLFNR